MGKADQGVDKGTGRYQVVPRTLCFVTHGDEVLLLRGSAERRVWPNRYNGVGGHVERDENVRQAAIREIREETGLQVGDMRLRGVINVEVEAEGPGILLFAFTAEAENKTTRPSSEGALVWVAQDRVLDYDLVEDLPTLLPRVLSTPPDTPPFFAHYHYDADDRLIIEFADE